MRRQGWLILALILVAVPLLVACAASAGPGASTAPQPQAQSAAPVASANPTRIGSKNFTEQLILGEMYAQLLEANGFKVERDLNLGGTLVAHEALTNGKIDLYPEYTGTGLLAILKLPTQSDPKAVYDTVAKQYKEKFNLVWLDQTPMNDTQALAVKKQLSDEKKLKSISDMVKIADQLVLATVPDFPDREDGLVGLRKVYGDFSFKEMKIFDPGIKYKAFLDGQANVVLAFGTDGQIKGYNLVVLEDDKGLWPPYHVAPVVRQQTLDQNPSLPKLLNQAAPMLTGEVMQDLNWQVDGPDKKDPAAVAREFLKGKGLVKQ